MRRVVFLILAISVPFFGFSQSADEDGFWQAESEVAAVGNSPNTRASAVAPAVKESDTAGKESDSAPWGFGELHLGMSAAEVKTVLSQSKDFSYRHFTESMLPYTELPVFECKGSRFIDRAVFQFYEEKLYSMTVFFDRRKLDYYTLFTTLTQRYGAHSELNPRRVVWESDGYRLTLTKPLTLSFLDAVVHNELLNQSEIRKDEETVSKQQFLQQFGAPENGVDTEQPNAERENEVR